jgi:hypothetical protein
MIWFNVGGEMPKIVGASRCLRAGRGTTLIRCFIRTSSTLQMRFFGVALVSLWSAFGTRLGAFWQGFGSRLAAAW